MRTLKFALMLPPIQLAIALALLLFRGTRPFPPHGDELYVSTARMVCLGITAPAWLLAILADALPIPQIRAFGLPNTDLFFLLGVGVTWYLVGRAVDARLLPPQKQHSHRIPLYVLLIVIGVVLLVMARGSLLHSYNNTVGSIASAALFLLWSLALIIYPAAQMFQRPRPGNTDLGQDGSR